MHPITPKTKAEAHNIITMQKITLDTSDTPYTLDTYATFTMDNTDEYMLENERETNPNAEYDDFDWTCDHKGYLQSLADNWLVLMRENILDSVILAIEITGAPISPREYNFSTDRAPIEITYNETALLEYIAKHREQYEKEKRHSYDGYIWLGDERDNEIMWYMQNASTVLYTPDAYVMDQYEYMNEREFDYVTCTLLPLCKNCNARARNAAGDCFTCEKKAKESRDQAMRAKEERFLASQGLTREEFKELLPASIGLLRKEWQVFEVE